MLFLRETSDTYTSSVFLFALQKPPPKKKQLNNKKKHTHVYERSHFLPFSASFSPFFTLFTPSCQRPVVWSHTNRIEQWWHGRRNGSFRDQDLKNRPGRGETVWWYDDKWLMIGDLWLLSVSLSLVSSLSYSLLSSSSSFSYYLGLVRINLVWLNLKIMLVAGHVQHSAKQYVTQKSKWMGHQSCRKGHQPSSHLFRSCTTITNFTPLQKSSLDQSQKVSLWSARQYPLKRNLKWCGCHQVSATSKQPYQNQPRNCGH